MSAIDIEDLTAGYGKTTVLRDTTLHVESGSLTCVLGESGCGKTTLLRVVAGFEPARSGSVRVGDRVLDDGRTRLAPERRRVGYVPQEGALFPHLTIGANVAFGLRSERAGRRARVDELLQLVGLGELHDRYPHQISGGQQQRAAVARALAIDPDIVLLDEPFAALDASLRERIRNDIRGVLRVAGVTAMLVTHDRAEALSLADNVAVMRDGRIAQVAGPRELYLQPADRYIARFVSDATLLEATVDGDRVRTRLGDVAVVPDSPVRVGRGLAVVRPDQVRVQSPPGVGGVGTGVSGRVLRTEYFGHGSRVEVLIPAADGPVTVSARLGADAVPEEGAEVTLAVDGPVWVVGTEGP